ncbi:MAG: hypothetical protein LBI92_10540 [Azoarcus sp.]|nr:hypothetical protein [Azoarcus sp.]
MPRELWIATKHIAVYASETDGEEVILFQLKPGDVCTPLREVAIKVYLHSEILCEKGKGWVIDKTSFDVRKAD